MPQLKEESQTKSKIVMSWSSGKKKEGFFVSFLLSKGNFFKICFISMYSVLNTLSEYTHFYISKNITSYICCLFLKLTKRLVYP